MSKSNLSGKSVLFIAYFFPPVDSTEVPGAMRTLKFVRNLEGGDLHVLTTPPRMEESRSALAHVQLPVNDEYIHRVKPWDIFKMLLSLRDWVKGLKQRKGVTNTAPAAAPNPFKTDTNSNDTRSHAQQLKDFVYNLCYFPDQAGPWILPAYFYGKKLVKEKRIDAIFATGSPWSGLFAGYLISRATGKPLIVDFRDPWMNNPFHQSKGALLDKWSVKMERAIVHHAAAISLNTEPLMEEFLERYPNLDRNRFFVMPNGYDLSDLADVSPPTSAPQNDHITLCHAGFLYGVRDPAVLLEAIRAANARNKGNQRKLRFRQIGAVQLGYDIRSRFADMLSDGSLVLDPPRPYQECLSELLLADWVVNVQPATRSQVPSKLYDYLALNKPILNITPREGALGRIVAKYELGLLFDFDELDALTNALLEITSTHNPEQPFQGYSARSLFDCVTIADVLAKRIVALT